MDTSAFDMAAKLIGKEAGDVTAWTQETDTAKRVEMLNNYLIANNEFTQPVKLSLAMSMLMRALAQYMAVLHVAQVIVQDGFVESQDLATYMKNSA